MKKAIYTIFIALLSLPLSGQYFYGVKGGYGLNFQQWNSFERDLLFTPLIDVFMETHDDPRNKLYASLGFHTRGSGIRGIGVNTFNVFNAYKFHNIVAEVGFKQVLSVDKKYNPYYVLAGRLEYTAATNLEETGTFSVFNLVSETFVNRLNYGLTVGGGFEHNISDSKIVFVEFTINPDASRQYHQPNQVTVINPNPSQFNPNQTITIRPQEVRNVSLELKIGIKFLQGYWEEEDY